MVATTPTPSVVAYATDGRRTRPPGFPLTATVLTPDSWPLARSLAAVVDCVVLTRAPGAAGDVAALARDVRARAETPLLVRAELTPAERAALAAVAATVAVATDVDATAVWAAVQAATSGHLLATVASGLGGSRLPLALRRAGDALCTLDPPPPSVVALCEHVGVPRRTLWYQWRARATRRGSGGVRLEDAVIAVVLLRASMRWAAGASWRDAAAAIGVHRHTLTRAARHAGLPGLPSMQSGAPADALHAAARRVVVGKLAAPLLPSQALASLTEAVMSDP